MQNDVPPKLGPYEILDQLGAGGMGRVYRARDTRLGRHVALKVLPDEVKQDRRRQARFEQEARSTSALNHPNIACIYDIGSDQGVLYVVSELVDGESLRALISRGPVPLAKLLDLAIQTAEGMGAAHSAGIVHRDLKPENILLSREGRVKIIDFGLAKQVEQPEGELGQSAETVLMTEPGLVVGTPAYMSPEQIGAQRTDQRCDIFSLGAVLYEMASGRRAFSGGSRAEITYSILTRDPPPLPSVIGRDLDLLIRRCLEKLPERRFRTGADLKSALECIRNAPNYRGEGRPYRVLVASSAAAMIFVAGIIGTMIYRSHSRAPVTENVVRNTKSSTSSASSASFSSPIRMPASGKAADLSAERAGSGDRAALAHSFQQTPAAAQLQSVKPQTRPAVNPERVKSATTRIVQALTESRYGDVARIFDDGLSAALNVERLQATWELTRRQLGNLVWVREPLLQENTAVVWLEFELGVIDLKLGFADDDHLAQIWYNSFAPPQPAYGVQKSPLNLEAARAAFGQGDFLLQQRKNEDALKRLNEAIQDNADYTEAYKDRCLALVRIGQFGRALVDCTHAIHLKPDDYLQYRYRGDASAGLKQWDDAFAAYNEAIRLKSDDSAAYNQAAWAAENESRYDLCVEKATRGIRLTATSAALWHNRSYCYEHLQKYDLAAADATHAIALTRDPKDYNHRGSIYSEAKQYQKALDDFNEAIRLKPDYKDAYNNRGFVKDMLGDESGAAADREYARELLQ